METIVWGLIGLGIAVGVGFIISGLLHTEERELEIMNRAIPERTQVSSSEEAEWAGGQRSA